MRRRLWHAFFGHPVIEIDLREEALSLAACAGCGYIWPQISVGFLASLRVVDEADLAENADILNDGAVG